MNAMVLLIGGQPLPNLLPIRHYRPDAVLMVYTATTEKVYGRLRETVERADISVYPLETDAYSIVDIAESLEKRVGQLGFTGRQLTFNVTGGTKAMALAAFQVARRFNAELLYLESESKRTRVYHYVWERDGLNPLSADLLPTCVTLDDFFDVYLGPGAWEECGAGRQDGSSFEVAIADTLRPHVDGVVLGVKAMGGQLDLDVTVQVGNQFGIIEAKAGRNGARLDGVKQLSNASRHLGTFTKQFYAITMKPNKAHEAIVAASRIRVVSLEGYQAGSTTLPAEDARTLVTAVRDALGG